MRWLAFVHAANAKSMDSLAALEGGTRLGALAAPPAMETVEQLLAEAESSWTFNSFALAEATQGHPLSTLAFYLFSRANLLTYFNINPIKLARFLRAVEDGYRDVPYQWVPRRLPYLWTAFAHSFSASAAAIGPMQQTSCKQCTSSSHVGALRLAMRTTRCSWLCTWRPLGTMWSMQGLRMTF
jgi:hypothetical protein